MSVTTRNFIALVVLFTVATSVTAIEQATIKIGNVSSEQLDILGLQMEIELQSNGLAVTATATTVQLPPPFGQLSNVVLRCNTFRWQTGQVHCPSGEIAFSHPQLGLQKMTFSVQSHADDEHYQFSLKGIRLGQGMADIETNYQQGKWQVQLQGKELEFDHLFAIAGSFVDIEQLDWVSQWNIHAVADMNALFTGQSQQLETMKLSSSLSQLGFSDPSGRYIAETVSADLELSMQLVDNRWQWHQTLNVRQGQAYFEPIYLDMTEQPVQLNSEGEVSLRDQQWEIHSIQLNHGDEVEVTGQLYGQATQFRDIQLTLKDSDLTQLYQNWLQPFVPGSALGKLQTSGDVSANLLWQANQFVVEMDLQSVSIADEAGRFSLNQLQGQVGWTNQDKILPVALSWESASVFTLPLGSSQLQAQVSNQNLQFTDSLSLPILDGSLSLNDFQLSLAEEGMHWQFQGLLSPVSMDQLSRLLGWPELQGKLSGMIPLVSYDNEAITVDGALLLKIFDGTTVIRDLRLQQPFGSLPQLYANIDINRLDLQTLTSTFDFGNISGKIDGRIHHLRLSDWQPVQFDAQFMTPEKDPGRRRISQRAVNNISQIGGGPSAILSRGFMGLFDDFSYQKIGLSCRLMNSVCQMDGVEATEQGYYIVKGGGLPPWINVVGYTREVDWPELIARLKAVSQSDGPVIQ